MMKLYILALMCSISVAEAATVYVSPQGDDASAGTKSKPYATLNRAVAELNAGDTCIVRGGIYRERVEFIKSGSAELPITVRAQEGEAVVVDGCDPLVLDWQVFHGNVYVAKCPFDIAQLFAGEKLLTEARWPNMNLEQCWDEEKRYARTGEGSEIGTIIHEGLAERHLDLNGCRVNIRIGKGQNLATRDVLDYVAGAKEIQYDMTALEIPTPSHFLREDLDPAKLKRFGLDNNRFYLEGGVSLIDTAGEWAWDAKKQELYLYAPDGVDPSSLDLNYKNRKIGFWADGRSHIQVEGITFRGCAIQFKGCSNCLFDSIQSFHPTAQRYFSTKADREKRTDDQAGAVNFFSGSRIQVRNSLFENALKDGVVLDGGEITIENSVVHDACLIGEHGYAGIKIVSGDRHKPSFVRSNTVYNCGAVGIRMHKYATRCEYNNVFNTGMYCHDVSAFYLPIYGYGSVFSHNWSHDNSGIAYRVDNKGKDITFHHNVAWNNASGMKLQGVGFDVFNNTILVDQPTASMMFVIDSKEDASFKTFDSRVNNNITYFLNIRDRSKGWIPISDSDEVSNNIRLAPGANSLSAVNGRFRTRMVGWKDFERVDPAQVFMNVSDDELDLRPATGSICDAGRGGKYPGYVGAYEPEGAFWVPGASWMPDGLKQPQTIQKATDLAWDLAEKAREDTKDLDDRVKSNI